MLNANYINLNLTLPMKQFCKKVLDGTALTAQATGNSLSAAQVLHNNGTTYYTKTYFTYFVWTHTQRC